MQFLKSLQYFRPEYAIFLTLAISDLVPAIPYTDSRLDNIQDLLWSSYTFKMGYKFIPIIIIKIIPNC